MSDEREEKAKVEGVPLRSSPKIPTYRHSSRGNPEKAKVEREKAPCRQEKALDVSAIPQGETGL